jgi:hypothetical protein
VKELAPQVGKVSACAALILPRSTFYRLRVNLKWRERNRKERNQCYR